MKKIILSKTVLVLFFVFITGSFFCQEKGGKTDMNKTVTDFIQLPTPEFKSSTSIEEAILKRRSIRDYTKESLSLKEVSQILWSAQGITDEASGLRSSPSAGATFPLEVYLAVSNVKDLNAGLYKYNPFNNTLKLFAEGDKRFDISNAALKQGSIEKSAAMIILTAVHERTSVRYGNRTERYVNMEIGHAGQNIYLQAVSLGLGTVMIGAFNDDALKKVMDLPDNEFPLAIYPLGKI